MFAAVAPLVREEWPELDTAKVAATDGDLDALVTLVAGHFDRTKTLVRRQLLELLDVAESRSKERAGRHVNGAAKKSEPSSRELETPQVEEVIAAVRRLEAFASEEVKRVSAKMVPVAESKVRQNLWVSLLMALGFGMIVGLWLNGGRRSR